MMAKPTLNFVWVGRPMFDRGGQDVVGPESIDRNFKTFSNADLPPNSMVFWCQEAYQEQYKAYFSEKKIAITVCSIESYLNACLSDPELSPPLRSQASQVLMYYHHLVLSPERNRTLDRVFMKDMFFNFLLATRGDYVLDTNIQAIQEKSVDFPAYSAFMFPTVLRDNGPCSEVWMQYAPKNHLKAKICLDCYLRLFEEVDVSCRPYSMEHHNQIGRVALGALHGQRSFSEKRHSIALNDLCNTWGPLEMYSMDAKVPALGVFKEYSNSHRACREDAYDAPHSHVYMGDVDRLRFDLDHGTPPDLEANPKRTTEITLNYDAEHETLLHIAMRMVHIESYKRCAQLLLERGADVNKTHQIAIDERPPQVESPLTYALKCRSESALQMLFDVATMPVNVSQIVNNYTPLMLAVRCKTGVNLLLMHGADPNQIFVGQKDTPLSFALKSGNADMVRLLLSHHADPLAVIQYEVDGHLVEQRVADIETTEACQVLLKEALKRLELEASMAEQMSGTSSLQEQLDMKKQAHAMRASGSSDTDVDILHAKTSLCTRAV